MPDRPSRPVLRRARRSDGFSLLELVVALAVLSILIGLAVPSMSRLLGDSQLSSTVNDLVFSLQSARSEAIKRAAPVSLCASADPLAADATCDGTSYASGWIVYADKVDVVDGTSTTRKELIVQNAPPGPAFSFALEGFTTNRVTFVDSGASASPGSAAPRSGSIRVGHAADERERLVKVAANGRITSADAPPASAAGTTP